MNSSQHFATIEPTDTKQELVKKAAVLVPTERQYNAQAMEMTAFLHFGMNTFTNREWGDGTEDPALFNPTDFDADQWIRILSETGFRGAILCCKHHDGFCLWNSAYTDYSVARSPWKDGKGDVVAEVSAACKKYGVKFGIYLSPWDRHDSRYGNSKEYNDYFCNQLTELLTNYGEVYDVWLDGACAEGPNGKRQQYDWGRFYGVIRNLCPNATISVSGPDIRWIGNEAGRGRKAEWSVVPLENEVSSPDGQQFYLPLKDQCLPDLGSGNALVKAQAAGIPRMGWYPAQVDTSIRPGWFYHKWQDDKVKPVDTLAAIYRASVGANAQLLLNIPANKEGKIAPVDEHILREFSRYLKETYSNCLSEGGETTTTVKDEVYYTRVTLPTPAVCNRVVLMEDIMQGQHIANFEVMGKSPDGEEKLLCSGKTVGYKKILTFEDTLLSEITVVTDGYRLPPVYASVGVYRAPLLNTAPTISRDSKGYVTITAPEGTKVYYGIGRDEINIPYTEPFLFTPSGTVRAIAKYERDDIFSDECPVGQVMLGISRRHWKVLSSTVDPVEGCLLSDIITSTAGALRIPTAEPFSILIDMAKPRKVSGWIYQPPLFWKMAVNNIYAYRLEISDDMENWRLLNESAFDNLRSNPVRQICNFKHPDVGRYLRLTVLSSFGESETDVGKIALFE